MGIERAHEHIEVGRVVGDLRFRLEARRLVLVRAPLPELRYRRGGAPDLIVILCIYYRGRGRTRCRGAAVSRRGDGSTSRYLCLGAKVPRLVGNLQTQRESEEGGNNDHRGIQSGRRGYCRLQVVGYSIGPNRWK